MKNVVTHLYSDYGKYIDKLRAIPYYIDALKPVERRLLLSIHDVARKKPVKSAKVVGECIARYHPHGDMSTYESLVGLVNRGFAVGQGNFGYPGLVDAKAAAQRYCVTGDTFILSSYGITPITKLNPSNGNQFNPIKEDINVEIQSIDNTINTATKFFDMGKHPIIQIETSYGYQLKGTPNHPIMILNSDLDFEWKLLEDIKVNDVALINIRSPDLNKNDTHHKSLSKDMGIILGCLVSEGWYSEQKGHGKIGISNTDLEYVLGFETALNNEYPNYLTYSESKSNLPSGKELKSIEICNKNIIDSIKTSGFNCKKSIRQDIPEQIFESNIECQSIFLQYLFEGDGSIGIGKRTNVTIIYSSISIDLIKNLRMLLLLSFGITSRIYKFKNTKEFRLLIEGLTNARIFQSKINFVSDRKRNKLKSFLDDNTDIEGNAIRDKIPHIKKYINDKYGAKTKGIINNFIKKQKYSTIESLVRKSKTLLSFIDEEDRKKLERICNCDYIFLPIKNINKLKNDNVYSIRVDSECHSFNANGFVNHNTEVGTNKFLDKLFSEFIKFVPWSEIELDEEPHYLPAPVPLGLVGDGIIQGIAIHTTKIPRYGFLDLLKRLKALINKDPNPPIIQPIIKGNTVYEDSPGQYQQIFQQGSGIIFAVPEMEVNYQYIMVKAKNPLYGLSRLISHNEDYEKMNGVAYYNVEDLTDKDGFRVKVTARSGKVDQAFVDTIYKLISTKIHINCNFVTDQGYVDKFPLDYILIECYNRWVQAWILKLQSDLSSAKNELFELQVIEVVRQIFESNPTVKNVNDICQIYSKKMQHIQNIGETAIRDVCKRKSIQRLIEAKIDKSKVQTQIVDIQNNIQNINQIALNKINGMVQ